MCGKEETMNRPKEVTEAIHFVKDYAKHAAVYNYNMCVILGYIHNLEKFKQAALDAAERNTDDGK